MGRFFFDWGRTLGRAGMPVFEQAKWAWKALAGSAEDRRQAEEDLGRTMASQIRAEASQGAAADLELVRTLGAQLAARLRDKQWRFRIEVVQLAEPSALALPGGFIFVSTPLLDLCHRYADELAFVVGHEMAHVVRGHATDRFLQDSLLRALANRLGRGSPLGGLLKDTTLQLLSSAYSQECEFEADEFGSRLAEAAGHHPLAGVRLLDRLQRFHAPSSLLGEYFSSHPTPAERMARLGSLWKHAQP